MDYLCRMQDYQLHFLLMTGEEFKQAREKMRLTQTELASRLGVTETTLYRWENGKAPISKAIELAMRQIRTDLRNEDAQD